MSQNISIEGDKNFRFNWRELYDKRQLLFFFVWRNFKIRYKQTAVGAAWAMIQPLILMVVFTVFFNRLAGIGSGSTDVPYPIFAFAGLMFWGYFSSALSQTSTSLVSFQGVIKKIYFPRLIAPLASVFTPIIDFGFSLLIYIGLMFWYGITPTLAGVLMFIPLLLLSMITVTGLGSLLAAINIKYRDVAQALPFFIQSMLFITPVIYPVALVSERWQWILFLNPMAGVIETARAGLLGTGPINWAHLAISTSVAIILLVVGISYFYRRERKFADLI